MTLSKSAVMAQVCDCGKLILGDAVTDAKYVSFVMADFSAHGIWDGIKGEHITFDDEKKWCSIDCLIEAIQGYDYEAK